MSALIIWILTVGFPPQSDYLKYVNEIRGNGCECGGQFYPAVPPVTWNKVLEKTAALHSRDMADKKYFSHISKRGKNPGDRLRAQGYRFSAFAENIFFAKGYTPTSQEVVLAWKNSPSHCKNLMNPAVSEMGVGIHAGYYTQLFGSRQTK